MAAHKVYALRPFKPQTDCQKRAVIVQRLDQLDTLIAGYNRLLNLPDCPGNAVLMQITRKEKIDGIAKKERMTELIRLAEEMGLDIPVEAKVIQLKNLIESSNLYRDDIDFVRELMSNIQEEKRDEIELQKLKLSQFEKELELINAKKSLADISQISETKESSSLTDNLECLIRSVKVLTIPVPVKSESYVLRFLNNLKQSVILSGSLSASELDLAETKLIRMAQREIFSAEIRNLHYHKIILPNSKIKNLNPFLDRDGILRVGGRLGNSDLPYVAKYPAILPSNHKLTNIIMYF
ncbi:integrase catalytic domain-containing protein [Trichonephila clavata]|uniref:Integrase catalytic domain-containing protein n=1 Tax=Trichonephila clavata TaxID=2740835 RepID=A0A8X6KH80_TRICU|nr:integrase catalytic domain-containing protein [Trichonephila clavata]